MNRAERRRQKKAGIKVQKEPTLNLKVSDFDHMVSHAEKSAKDRATAAAIHEIDRQILEHDEAYSLDIDNQWYFEGVEVKKTAKKAQLSSMYGEMKEGK